MLRNLTIRTSLVWGMGFLSAMLLVLGALGLFSLHGSNGELRAMYADRLLPMQQLSQVMAALDRSRSGIAAAILNPADVESDMRALEQSLRAGEAAWKAYAASALTEQERALAADFARRYEQLKKDGVMPAMEAVRSFNIPGATELYSQNLAPLHQQAGAPMTRLIALQQEAGRAIYEASQQRYHAIFAACLAAMCAGLGFALLMGVLLVRAISRPLAQAVGIAEGVAAGDLGQHIAAAGDNETGKLMQALATMNANLVGIVAKVHQSTRAIAAASAEIGNGNRDLSERTERQAASLEETASSMETLTATVRQNAEGAQQANAMAQQAAGVAADGGAVVAQVVDTMSAINAASRKIVEIIAVIDSIAFQTNILALNAAVEAARAGEQGRGFAVVASEVRALAQRSAAAAREIKGLIGDTVGKVDAGSRLVEKAGATMQQVMDSINNVTQVVASIADASDDQRHGIEQINQAIAQMDEGTQQNAALVEQAAASAMALQLQARELAAAVGAFRIAPTAEAVPPQPSPELRLLPA
ncbi:methyl-accepting chemotaxis protein [Herbaspirillum robiniae]|uniref:Methyl-accepting chemotaxis protein n=1 Tax=Herbaspirillum robiniae TaxID=2014887 RepID=A0A246WSR4_9BURK|nr:methyl-accepting chemotaxis protein [Herbaspirillum robiniae]OWY29169.1 methyl-accepting chemotaxis protein [Herbaspirillum robiniae]